MAKSLVEHYLLKDNHNVLVLVPPRCQSRMNAFADDGLTALTSNLAYRCLQLEVDDLRAQMIATGIYKLVPRLDIVIIVPRILVAGYLEPQDLNVAIADEVSYPFNTFLHFANLLQRASNPKFVVVSPVLTDSGTLLKKHATAFRAMQAGMHVILEQLHDDGDFSKMISPGNITDLLSLNADPNNVLPEADSEAVRKVADVIKNSSREKDGGKWVM